ncbi:MAG: protein translocase subunit SecF [Armatimonadetes bacterium]|nr:protein translocase subunit SecF [Armatimonadota bacterium]
MNSQTTYDLVGRRRLWYSISIAVILFGMYFYQPFTQGINLGIDFTGGAIFRYRFPANNIPPKRQHLDTINQVRDQLHDADLSTGTIQISGSDELYIRTQARIESERNAHGRKISEVLLKQFPGIEEIGSELVGPVIGQDLKMKATIGVFLGCCLIAIWIWIRYNAMGDGLRYAAAGIIALIHDVLVMVGLFALAGKISPRIEADSSFVAALLTVVGYSINDSVVIFDRIRENLSLRRRDPFALIVNDSLLQTMARSINTVLTVELTLVALFLFGGETIHSFMLALIIGITAGAYSSIFVAGPILVSWKALDEKRKPVLVPSKKKETRNEPVTPASRAAVPITTAPTRTVTARAVSANSNEAEGEEPAEVVVGDSDDAARKKKASAAKRGKRKRRF